MYQKMLNPLNGEELKCVVRLSDGASIPNDPMNRDYQEYISWVRAGGVPLDPAPYEPPVVEPEPVDEGVDSAPVQPE